MTANISSGMPQIAAAFAGWMKRITLLKHIELVVNGLTVIRQTVIRFSGTIQPLSARALALKPEGQRSWTWLQIHCFSKGVNLIPGDRITWNGSVYKVMEHKDYSLNGYIEYHIIRDFQRGGTE